MRVKTIKFGTPITWNPDGPKTGWYSNTFNGTFSNQHAGLPSGVMINRGKVIQPNSSHHIWRYPETCIWIKKDGSFGSDRVQTYTQIKGYQDIVFAISGLGISDYDPKAEGFCEFSAENIYNGKIENKDFDDVLEYTNHSVFGFRKGVFFACIFEGSAEQATEYFKDCEHVIMGDGRSWAACNTDDLKLNLHHVQYSLVQVTNVVDDIDLHDPTVREDVRETIPIKGTNQEGTSNLFRLSDLKNPHTPVIPGLHFYWDEYLQNNLALKGYEDDYNIIETPQIMYEIVFHALMMEEFRSKLGRGITATSGHRPEVYNDVVLIKKGYKSTTTSDHKCINSCALDTNVPVSSINISNWKNLCYKYGVSWSIGLYSWGMHLGYRRGKDNRLWDWR